MKMTQLASAMILGAALCAPIGCSKERHRYIPPTAQQMSMGKDVNFTAPEDGRVFIHDISDAAVIYGGWMNKGQKLTLDKPNNRLLIDGVIARDKVMISNTRAIYFEPANTNTKD
jgi:hypothetical protein